MVMTLVGMCEAPGFRRLKSIGPLMRAWVFIAPKLPNYAIIS